MSTTTSAAALAGVALFASAVGAQSPEILDATPLGRVDISQFRTDDPTIFAEPVDASGGAAFGVCWDNGAPDDVTAHQAQQTPIGFFQAADDIVVKAGDYKYIDKVCVCFLVSDTIDGTMFKPMVGLNVYEDCNGRPVPITCLGTVSPLTVGIDEGVTGVNNGPSAAFPGFNEWEFCFDTDMFIPGDARIWFAPYGVAPLTGPGSGLYYWRSANNGLIQGVQGQLKNGSQTWMDVQTCDCPGICTDFCFEVYGDRCCLALDSSPLDPTDGSKSLQLFGASIDTARGADNFQIPPGPDPIVSLCRIEAWMATNCPLDKVFLEIYENDCDCPGAKICTIDLADDTDGDGVADFPIVEDTGVDFLGCNIYRLTWPELNQFTLETGKDYWISVVAKGTGSILDKAYWMHKAIGGCEHLNITEGKVKDPFVAGLEDWLPISEATVTRTGVHDDFAFKIYTAAYMPPPHPSPCCLGDQCVELPVEACVSAGGATYKAASCAETLCVQATTTTPGARTGRRSGLQSTGAPLTR